MTIILEYMSSTNSQFTQLLHSLRDKSLDIRFKADISFDTDGASTLHHALHQRPRSHNIVNIVGDILPFRTISASTSSSAAAWAAMSLT